MIGIDANVLVRYIALDDARQAARAVDFLDRRLTAESPGYLTLVALVETVWVLGRSYKLTRREITTALLRLLSADNIVVEGRRDVLRAANLLRKSNADFADVLIEAIGRRQGCTHTVTFDKGALRLPGFAPVP